MLNFPIYPNPFSQHQMITSAIPHNVRNLVKIRSPGASLQIFEIWFCDFVLYFSFLLGSISESVSVYCDMCYHSVVCPSVCMSYVTLVHPAKAVGQNEVPFGRDTHVVPSNIVLDGAQCPTGRGDWGQNPQFTLMPPDTQLLWQLFVTFVNWAVLSHKLLLFFIIHCVSIKRATFSLCL